MKKHLAMTLAELVIVFTIIGLIAGLALVTIKPYKKTTRYLYSRVYDALDTAMYNILSADNKAFPSTSQELCELLTGYLNYTGSSPSCSATEIATSIDQLNTMPEFTTSKIKFTATNGARFYISALLKDTLADDDSNELNINYFIVFVDLNGDRGPNSASTAITETVSDIVPFAIIDTGDVVPLGRPTRDKTYLGAKVLYPPTEATPEDHYSNTMTYQQAQLTAWGDVTNLNNIKSIDLATLLFNAGSPIQPPIDTSATLNTAEGCVQGTTNCTVEIQLYY